MPIKESTEEGVPDRWVPPVLYDFRAMPDGPRGYKVGITKKGHLGSKRKLDEYAEQVRLRRNLAFFSACAISHACVSPACSGDMASGWTSVRFFYMYMCERDACGGYRRSAHVDPVEYTGGYAGGDTGGDTGGYSPTESPTESPTKSPTESPTESLTLYPVSLAGHAG